MGDFERERRSPGRVEIAEINDRVEMMVVAAGEFLMGEGDDAHSVYVTVFALARYPVTNADYQSFVNATGHAPPRDWPAGHFVEMLHDHPVVNVSWYDALAYCDWLRATLEAFWNFELPEELTKDYGYPPLTEQAKRKILGENLARLHGIDVAAKKKELGLAA